jgi:hypothetical protein
MTDFGKRTGDMCKSTYDTNNSGVVDAAEAIPAHKASHESEGSDPIDVTGLVGATPLAILGDATAGRVLRAIFVNIRDGTNANTLKVDTTNKFNGDIIAQTDNIAKGSTVGHFSLSSNGKELRIENSGLSGNVYCPMASMNANFTGIPLDVQAKAIGYGIRMKFMHSDTGASQDITVLVDSDNIYPEVLYLTSE